MSATGAGATQRAATTATPGVTVVVRAPRAGTWYRWQVRSVGPGGTSAWVTASVTVPRVVGRLSAAGQAVLATAGLRTSTSARPGTPPASVGRVLSQSAPRGSTRRLGTVVALVVGSA
jgi:beta-lactam-binding protein with PASTA domain